LFRTTERLVSEESWYQGGYRANVVTYSVAKLAQMLDERFSDRTLDMRHLWNQQNLPESLRTVLKRIAKEMFDVIVNPDSAFQNVTEWCKKELCWKRASGIELDCDLGRQLRSLLLEKEEERHIQRSARQDQRIGDGIENQRLVLELGPTYWTTARKWGREQAVTSPDEDSILAVAASMPRKLPSEKQSWRLIQIKEKLELEGFPKREQLKH
jgi:hypothetical protein